MCQREEKRREGCSSYESVFEEVDVGVPPVIKGCVDGTEHPWETLRDQPGIAVTFRVLSEHLVILIVIPPEQGTCTQKPQSLSIIFRVTL